MLVFAIWIRIPYFTLPTGVDAARTLVYVLESGSLSEFRSIDLYEYQPILTYIIWKYFVFSLFEFSEISVRLLPTFFSLLTSFVAGILAVKFLERNEAYMGVSQKFRLVFMIVWISLPSLLFSIAWSRGYAATIFISMCWFYFFNSLERKSSWIVFIFSLVFLNAHFFAYIPVAFFYLYEIFKYVFRRERGLAFLLTIHLLLLVSISAVINFPNLSHLIETVMLPTKDYPSFNISSSFILIKTWSCWFNWISFNGPVFLVFSGLLLYDSIGKWRLRFAPICLFSFIILPLFYFFTVIGIDNDLVDRNYAERYNSAFIGALFLIMLGGVQVLLEILAKLDATKKNLIIAVVSICSILPIVTKLDLSPSIFNLKKIIDNEYSMENRALIELKKYGIKNVVWYTNICAFHFFPKFFTKSENIKQELLLSAGNNNGCLNYNKENVSGDLFEKKGKVAIVISQISTRPGSKCNSDIFMPFAFRGNNCIWIFPNIDPQSLSQRKTMVHDFIRANSGSN